MKTKITTTMNIYYGEDLKRMKKLKKFGFKFNKNMKNRIGGWKENAFEIKPMTITVNTPEDIMKIVKFFNCPVIVDRYDELEIYNDYRE